MNKEQYLDELSRKLSRYPEEFRQEIMDSFRQHFADGQAEGKSDEEIISHLGSVEEVLENVEYYDQSRDTGNSDSFRELAHSFSNLGKAVKDLFSSLSNTNFSITFGMDDAEFVEFPDWQGASEVLFDANLADCDVSVEPGKSLRYAFSSNSPDDIRLNVERQGERITFSIDRNLKVFPTVSGRLRLEIPEDIQNVYVNGVSGDVEISDLSLNNIVVNSLSGDLELQEVTGSECIYKSTSGDLEVSDCRFRQISVEATSGDVEVSDCRSDLMIRTTSGDCDINSHEGRVLINTTSGDIDISMSRAFDISCETKSGDIEVEIEDGNYSAEVNTVSGDVSTSGIASVRKNRGHYLVGDGEASVVLRTLSGDISLSD
ncbi:MAG: DUF4097 family beta strand repeat protein [Erysipelotrichaceae bacterium]|nr:DUF4097 family beta strand repeat protein [Erysipelotrichaceae bacterium]